MAPRWLRVGLLLLHLSAAVVSSGDSALRTRGEREAAGRMAQRHGFTNMGQIGNLKSYYSFRHREAAAAASAEEAAEGVATEPEVERLQQQVVQRRVNRNSRAGHASSDETRRRPAHPAFDGARSPLNNQSVSMWHLLCSGESCMNIAAAWRRGYTGKGVVVSVLDDGIEEEHPDLKPNYDPLASSDVSGPDPEDPEESNKASHSHGTQCAAMVAASNSLCSVGVSFQARIGGVRMLDGHVTDAVEARALSFRPQHIDIYLASWGPEDDGATLEGPGPLAQLALQSGINTGRGGRGSVFVWASGAGGRRGDHCSCDGYSSSIFTVSISSSTRSGNPPEHLERCAATMAAAHTGGEGEEMVTAAPQQSCSRAAAAASLSSSIAAGVIALTLEANPSLTWRDVQHLIVRTSKPRHLLAPDWSVNGAGFKVSHLYGFGLLDADLMVQEAERWASVPEQHQCVQEASRQLSRTFRPGSSLTSVFVSSGCSGEPSRRVVHVEHVVVRLVIAHGRRGDLSITLASPSGTVSQLLANRPLDDSTEGFPDWDFMTTHSWGERAAGEWTLTIQDASSQRRDDAEPGFLKACSLLLYGTERRPDRRRHERAAGSAQTSTDSGLAEEYSGPCDAECSDDGCEGRGPQRCVTCSHFFLKFKNSTRLCVSECPRGFWGDRRRCKRCFSSCESCTGSRSDQCTSCQPGHHLTERSGSCTAACGEDEYLDHDANMCRKCSANCLTCTSFSICSQCGPDTSLQGTRCRRSCSPGFYLDEQEGACERCHEACATCAGAGVAACNRCAEGFLMEEWRCVSSCSAGFYAAEPSPETADGQRTCGRCDASCLTCVESSRGNCSSCSGGRSLQEGVCVVSSVCTDGEFHGGDGRCRACDASCLTCAAPQSDACISCSAARVLDAGRCVLDCVKGKYRSGGQCHLCDHSCATCEDGGPANCTSCDTDKFGQQRFLLAGRCLDACPEAFYHTEQSSCRRCSAQCRRCSGAARCLQCNASYFLSSGVCTKLECGEGEVEDPDYDDCMACEEGCRKCVLYNPKHCLSCTEGFYSFQDGCYKNCPAKTFSVAEEMSCVACEENCVSCDEHECYWCETDLFLSEGRCVSTCPDGFFGDEDTNDCEACDAACAACGGARPDDCLSCEDGKTLRGGECVSDHERCPAHSFLSGDAECEDCHPSCASCSGGEKDQCSTCAEGAFLTTQRTCVSTCPGGFFASRPAGVCASCALGCVQCEDAERCTRCQSGRRAPLFLQAGRCVQRCVRGFPAGQTCRSCAPGCASCEKNATRCLSCDGALLLHEQQCVQECPAAHRLQDGECRRCPAACQRCGAAGRCSACEELHFLLEGQCERDCPAGFFEDGERRACLSCHPDCALCDGPNSNDCDACADPEATLHMGACLAACPAHTYRDAVTGACEDCDASCFSCAGARSCSSCRDGRRLEAGGRCASGACSPRHYADQDGECRPCHKYCLRCSGPGSARCLSCSQRHLLLNGTCVDGCPAGHFEAAGRCDPCHPSCQACVGKHSHECLACKVHLFREGKDCVETCRHSHYGNAGSRACEPCDAGCSDCTAGEEDGCLSCAAGLLFLRREGRCLPACPPGFYHDAAHGTCEACHARCSTCSGRDSRSCDSCFSGFLLSAGECESMCASGRYPVMQDSAHACADCDGSCLECRGPGPANCTACPPLAILEEGGRCLLCCRHEEEEEEEEEAAAEQQDCCNCTETRGECVLSTRLAFRNEEEEEAGGNPAVFIISSVLLLLGLVAVVFIVRRSRSKRAPPDITPRGYEKLGGGSGGRFQDARLVDAAERRSGRKSDEEEDEDDEDDEDIVYMGQDGTVYRKFRYGQLGEDNEDELEYDDESYTFR